MPKLIQRLKTAYKAFWGSGDWVNSNHFREGSFTFQPGTQIDYTTLNGNIYKNSAVQAVLNRIVLAWPESYPCVKKKVGDKKEVVEEHPAAELLSSPNPAYDDTVLWAGTIASFWGDGNAYWGINRSALGIEEFVYIPHYCITPKRAEGSKNPGADYYEYYHQGKRILIPPADIVHYRFGVHPYNDLIGLSPWASVDREVYTDNEAANYVNTMLKNQGASWIIASPKHPDAYFAEPETVKAKIESHTTGDNRHRALIMDGATEFIFPPSMKDTGPDALRRTPETRIAALAGFPAIWCGFQAGLEKSTYSNTEQAAKDAWHTIVAVQRMMGRQATRQILRRPGNFETRWHNKKFYIGFDYSEVRALQVDKNAEAQRVVSLVNASILTVDEARAEIDYPALTDAQKAEMMPEEPEDGTEAEDTEESGKAYHSLRQKIAIEASAREAEFRKLFGENPAEDDDIEANRRQLARNGNH